MIVDKIKFLYYNNIKRKESIILKKFIIVLLIIIFVLICFTSCKQNTIQETVQPTLPENGIVVTPAPIEETAEAEDAIIEIKNTK